jgi:hypothetical protein
MKVRPYYQSVKLLRFDGCQSLTATTWFLTRPTVNYNVCYTTSIEHHRRASIADWDEMHEMNDLCHVVVPDRPDSCLPKRKFSGAWRSESMV